MNEVKISVITVCYNSEKTINQTIESLLNQSFQNFEYILVDGASNDKTLEIIQSYSDKFLEKGINYKYISEKDNGIYDAMNKGINLSTGEIIGIVNSDDWYEKDALQNIINVYLKEESDIIYGLLRTIDEDNNPEKIMGNYKSNGIGVHPTVFVKKDIYNRYGVFNLDYRLAADTELLIRLSRENLKIDMIEKVITNFRITGATTKYEYLSKKESIQIEFKYGRITKSKKVILDFKNLVKINLKKYFI
ncbi:MAG: glycosyltransferase family 2 protein [Fusobacteriaceae bacterium]